MTIFIWIFMLISNFYLGIMGKKCKIIGVISVIVLVMLLGGNFQNADFAGYNRYYNSQIYAASMEPGYVYLSSLCHSIGLDYQIFVLLLMVFAIVPTGIVVFYYKVNIHLILSLYLATLFFLDAVQIRQTVAYSFFTLAIMFMSRKKRLLGVLAIIIASLFQWTAIAFLPLIFFDSQTKLSNKTLKCSVLLILVSCLFVFLNGNSLAFLMPVISKFVNSDKLLYFSTSTRFGFVLYFIFQFSCLYMSFVCKESIHRNSHSTKIVCFADLVYTAVRYACFAMPLVMLNNNFSRLFKYSLMSIFIQIAFIMSEYKGRKNAIKYGGKYVGSVWTFLVAVLIFLGIYEVVIQISTVVVDVLTYNIFF